MPVAAVHNMSAYISVGIRAPIILHTFCIYEWNEIRPTFCVCKKIIADEDSQQTEF